MVTKKSQYVELKEEKQSKPLSWKKLYLIHLMGFMQAIVLFSAIWFFLNKNYVLGFITLFLTFGFMPPYKRK